MLYLLKTFLTSITLVLSMAVMVFSVLAASNHSLGVDNYIVFDLGDNIACEIDALSAVGSSPYVLFNQEHSQVKTINLSTETDSDSSAFTYLDGNTTLTDTGTWAPWIEEAPALLSYSTDTVYWMFKITNKAENNIQVRISDLNDKTLFTMNKNMQLTKKFGTSESETPDQTDSGEIAQNQSVYVLVALETKVKTERLEDDWNFKIHIEKANASYLMTNWKGQLNETTRDNITAISFVGGDGEEYTGTYTGNICIGATDKTGEIELDGNEEDYPNVNQIIGYLNGTTLTIHSKGPIYAPVNSGYLFSPESEDEDDIGFANLTAITFDNFDTSNVIYMNNLFAAGCGCTTTSISELDVSNFDTSSVEDMSGMFCWMDSLTNLNISHLDTRNVINMDQMFSNCNLLTELDVSNFDTSNVENISYMFSGCNSLTELDVSNFDTSSVEDMSGMFGWMDSLTNLNISNFNTSNVENISYMFSDCSSLTELDLSSFNTSNVTNMSYMFDVCTSLTELDLSSFHIKSTCNVSNMLRLKGWESTTTAIRTLITPYFVGANIDINGLGLSLNGIAQTTIEAGTSNLTLRKVSFLMTGWKGEIDEATRDKITTINFVGGNGEEYSEEEPDFYFGATNEEGDETLYESADNQIKGYLEDTNTTLIITSKYPIYAPVDSCFLLASNDENDKYIGFQFLENLTFNNFHTNNVESMLGFFQGSCTDDYPLNNLDLTNFDTSNVTDMSCMFSSCSSLTELDLSNFDTSNVTDMLGMFISCISLTELDLSNFDTRNVESMGEMFSSCSSLTELDLSNFYTGSVAQMSDMFSNCTSLTELDLSNFNTSNVTNMSYMFYGCSSLTELDLSSFYIKADCNVSNMLRLKDWGGTTTAIETLKTPYYVGANIDINGLGLSLNGIAQTTIEAGTSNLILRKVSFLRKDWSSVVDKIDDAALIEIEGEREEIYIPEGSIIYYLGATDEIGNTPLDEQADNQIFGILDVDEFYIESKYPIYAPTDSAGLFAGLDTNAIVFNNFNTSNVEDMCQMFTNCESLENLDISSFDTSNVETMEGMFAGCSSLKTLDLSNFDTSKVENMMQMFENCTNVTEINLSSFDTTNLTDMESMFAGCSSLTTLDLSNFNTSKVEWMCNTFNSCDSLTELDLSNFNTSNVTTMEGMFAGCSLLETLDLSNFNTSQVESMCDMFNGCTGLEELDISSFNTRNVTDMGAMFRDCYRLLQLDLSSFYIIRDCFVTNMFMMVSNPPSMLTLTTPYYTEVDIDISGLALDKEIILAGSSTEMITA